MAAPQFAPDGTLWVTSDEGSDFQRLGTIDPATGRFTPVVADIHWDVENFDISEDGRTIAFITNEAGISRLQAARSAHRAASGSVTGLAGRDDRRPRDRALGHDRLQPLLGAQPVRRLFGRSAHAGGDPLDARARPAASTPSVNVEPRAGRGRAASTARRVSGFLYRPDPARFPGRRPLIVNIHGGPEGQSRPGFLGRNNYLLNELGIAIFYPNVRGSTGYGKRFVSLDNGPALRENSVRDIGAFLDRLAADPALDPARFAVTGGSYGGYMCYASAIRFGDRLRAANCVVAISNWVTFLENTQAYRRDLQARPNMATSATPPSARR